MRELVRDTVWWVAVLALLFSPFVLGALAYADSAHMDRQGRLAHAAADSAHRKG